MRFSCAERSAAKITSNERIASASDVSGISSWSFSSLKSTGDEFQVINSTISKDLAKATQEANRCEMALRQERLKLIKQKITAADAGANVSDVKGGTHTCKPAHMHTCMHKVTTVETYQFLSRHVARC